MDRNEGLLHRFEWLPTSVLLTVIVLVVSHLPLPEGTLPADLGTGVGDKTSHSVVYGLLAWCYLMALAREGRGLWRAVAVALLVLGIGILDEVTQRLVGRQSSLRDWLADALGVGLVAIGWTAWRLWRAEAVRHG